MRLCPKVGPSQLDTGWRSDEANEQGELQLVHGGHMTRGRYIMSKMDDDAPCTQEVKQKGSSIKRLGRRNLEGIDPTEADI